MRTIPVPTGNYKEWVNQMRAQDNRLSGYIPSLIWREWVEDLYNIVDDYFFVDPSAYSYWQEWAWDFLQANQGVE